MLLQTTISVKCPYCNAQLELDKRIVSKVRNAKKLEYVYQCHVCNCTNHLTEEDLPPQFLLILD